MRLAKPIPRDTLQMLRRDFRTTGRGNPSIQPDLIRSISTKAGKTAGGLQNVIDMLVHSVEQPIEERGLHLADDAIVRAFPTFSINAQTIRVDGGFIILINDGAMMLLHQAAKIMGRSLALSQVEAFSGKPPMSTEQAISALAEVVLAYIALGDTTYATRFPADASRRGMVASRITNDAELFLVAHEYGHLIGGHLDNPAGTTSLIMPTGSQLNLIRKSHEQEFAADEMAVELMTIRLAGRLGDDLETNRLLYRINAGGPLFFLMLDDLITRARNEVDGLPPSPLANNHPPSRERAAKLFDFFTNLGSEEMVRLAAVFTGWVTLYGGPFIEAMQEKIGHQTTS